MSEKKFMWANFAQLGSNMWNEPGNTRGREHRSTPCASDTFLFDREAWDTFIQYQKKMGINTLLLDVGEAMRYESHPEIAIPGAWTHEQMRAEVERLEGMGFEVIPKLNFSACHDEWLGVYSRMLSTPVYYEVCRDIIKDICDVFKPRFLHIGMDEETLPPQKDHLLVMMRQYDLWWHDLLYLVDCVEHNNVRAWVWSDPVWSNPEEYVSKMPKTVLQSNWYYGAEFETAVDRSLTRVRSFDLLDRHGYDQIPTGSNWSCDENIMELTKYCAEHVSEAHLLGIMQTTWERVAPGKWLEKYLNATDLLAEAKNWYENR